MITLEDIRSISRKDVRFRLGIAVAEDYNDVSWAIGYPHDSNGLSASEIDGLPRNTILQVGSELVRWETAGHD